MKRIIIIFLVILFIPTPILASEWTNLEKGLAYSYTGLVITDLIQSQHWIEYTADNPRILSNGLVYEKNKFVAGKSIETASIIAFGANYIFYKLLDNMSNKYRTPTLVLANIIEGIVVYNNHKTMRDFGFEYRVNFLIISF